MNIYFQSKHTEVHDDFKEFVAQRLGELNKFFPTPVNTYVDMEKTHNSHNGKDLYYMSVKIDDPEKLYFIEEYRENLRIAFDHVYDTLLRRVKGERKKSQTLTRRAKSALKNLFKRGK